MFHCKFREDKSQNSKVKSQKSKIRDYFREIPCSRCIRGEYFPRNSKEQISFRIKIPNPKLPTGKAGSNPNSSIINQ